MAETLPVFPEYELLLVPYALNFADYTVQVQFGREFLFTCEVAVLHQVQK